MLQSSSNLSEAVAKQSEAVEARDHFKNGASSKSLMSRENFFRITYFVLLALGVIILSACPSSSSSSSSSEKDGIKAAKKLCDCNDDMPEIVIKATEAYIKNFNFKSRIEAREKLNEMQKKVEADYYECRNKANAYREELGSKYHTNKESVEKFQYAYNAHRDAFRPKEEVYEFDYNERINSLVLKIKPPKPEFEKVKNDLIDRTINVSKYYINGNLTNTSYSWKINSEELKVFEILNTTDNGDEYLLLVRLVLERLAAAGTFQLKFDGNVNVTYMLGGNEEWNMRKMETVN